MRVRALVLVVPGADQQHVAHDDPAAARAPARLEHHRARQVAAVGRHLDVGRAEAEQAGVAVEDRAEHARASRSAAGRATRRCRSAPRARRSRSRTGRRTRRSAGTGSSRRRRPGRPAGGSARRPSARGSVGRSHPASSKQPRRGAGRARPAASPARAARGWPGASGSGGPPNARATASALPSPGDEEDDFARGVHEPGA